MKINKIVWQTTYQLQRQQEKWTSVTRSQITIKNRTTVQQVKTHTHTHTPCNQILKHMRARTHARTHTHVHTCSDTHMHTKPVVRTKQLLNATMMSAVFVLCLISENGILCYRFSIFLSIAVWAVLCLSLVYGEMVPGCQWSYPFTYFA